MSEHDADVAETPAKVSDIFDKLSSERLQQYQSSVSLKEFPFFRALGGQSDRASTWAGKPVLMFGSNNYLALTTDHRVKAAAVEAIERYGTGLTGSRVLNGSLALHDELEAELADWVGMESALVFTTGYAANLSLASAFVGDNDALLVDSAAHASLVDGATFSAGTLRAFRHNRINSLRRGLRSWANDPTHGGVLIAVDGIYSMEGDWAPLREIKDVCESSGARMVVDEAHALGVVGPDGAGSAAASSIVPDLLMGTFSKSLASCGGFVAGEADCIDFLRVHSRPLQFTAAGTPSALAAALTAMRIARVETWRREAVLSRANQLREGLSGLGYDVGTSHDSAIVPVYLNDVGLAALLWHALLEHGVYVNCAIPPAVARPLLRTSVVATHSGDDIRAALAAFEQVRHLASQE